MKAQLPHSQAEHLANKIIDKLRPYCTRIEIAGSIRRGKPMVGDIEIVAIPEFNKTMFGEYTMDMHKLNDVDWSEFGRVVKNGNKYKQIELHEGVNLDLFIVTPPAQWGVQFLLRTGPREYSHKFVTHKLHGGLMPSHLRVKDGAIWLSNNQIIETPEEIDVYNLIGAKYVTPELRYAEV